MRTTPRLLDPFPGRLRLLDADGAAISTFADGPELILLIDPAPDNEPAVILSKTNVAALRDALSIWLEWQLDG